MTDEWRPRSAYPLTAAHPSGNIVSSMYRTARAKSQRAAHPEIGDNTSWGLPGTQAAGAFLSRALPLTVVPRWPVPPRGQARLSVLAVLREYDPVSSSERTGLADLFASARSEGLVVLDGFHAVKHAARFGADIRCIATDSPDLVACLADALAPEMQDVLQRATVLTRDEFEQLSARRPPTAVLALARKPTPTVDDALRCGGGPVVLLEGPRHSGNAGAVIRVAAAAGARAVVATGDLDLWSEPVVRGSAGLHFAVDVVGGLAMVPSSDRTLWAVDPEGEPIGRAGLPSDVILAFGTERHGLTRDLKERAAGLVSLPMREGVSSLNLATAVSAMLYLRSELGGDRDSRSAR